jgi:hypothetical protein
MIFFVFDCQMRESRMRSGSHTIGRESPRWSGGKSEKQSADAILETSLTSQAYIFPLCVRCAAQVLPYDVLVIATGAAYPAVGLCTLNQVDP